MKFYEVRCREPLKGAPTHTLLMIKKTITQKRIARDWTCSSGKSNTLIRARGLQWRADKIFTLSLMIVFMRRRWSVSLLNTLMTIMRWSICDEICDFDFHKCCWPIGCRWVSELQNWYGEHIRKLRVVAKWSPSGKRRKRRFIIGRWQTDLIFVKKKKSATAISQTKKHSKNTYFTKLANLQQKCVNT